MRLEYMALCDNNGILTSPCTLAELVMTDPFIHKA